MPRLQSPPDPKLDEAIPRLLKEINGGTILLGKGQFCPYNEVEHLGAMRVDGDRPATLCFTGYLSQAQVQQIEAAIASVATIWPGEFDFINDDAWRFAWTLLPKSFCLYSPHIKRCELEGETFLVEGGFRREDRISLHEIEGIKVWVSRSWAKRGVKLLRTGGTEITIAEEHDDLAVSDYTYDRLDLGVGSSWAISLGKAMSKVLQVPCVVDDNLGDIEPESHELESQEPETEPDET